MAYEKVGWKDYPNTETPIVAELFNKMDNGIYENAKAIDDIINGNVTSKKAQQIGTDTIGTSTLPVFLNQGVPVQCSPSTQVKSNDEGIVSGAAVYTAINSAVANMKTEILNYTNAQLIGLRDGLRKEISLVDEKYKGELTAATRRISTLETRVSDLADRVTTLERKVR